MNFIIVWSDAAIQDLARIWLQVSNRNAITRASNQIDQVLSQNPQYVGESRAGNERVFFEDPLGVRFEVVIDDMIVTVGAVWLTRRV